MIQKVAVCENYCAILAENVVRLFTIEDASSEAVLPMKPGVDICELILTDDFIIVATDAGVICHFSREDFAVVSEFSHNVSILNCMSLS